MKKILIALLALTLVGCSTKKPVETQTPAPTETPVVTEGKVSVGVGSVTSFKVSDAAADKEGSAQVNTTFATVVLEGDLIKYVSFDTAQNSAKFDTTGKILTESDAKTPTKKEKKDDYGMRGSSEIGKEWFEQIAFLEEFALGKTVEEFLATAVDADAYPTDTDLLTGCTMKINGYLAAFEVAANNAVEVEGASEVGLGSSTSMSLRDADADKEGRVQANTTYAVVALDESGLIVYNAIDTAQNSIAITLEGIATASEDTRTKKEKLEDYGMREASPIKKEWFEQIASLEEYSLGKSVADFLAVPTEENVPTGEDLITSVTMDIESYLKAVETANNNKVSVK
ncbi:MAG: hypothetical protein ACK5KQ_01705 [Anaerorhabdus sp.]